MIERNVRNTVSWKMPVLIKKVKKKIWDPPTSEKIRHPFWLTLIKKTADQFIKHHSEHDICLV